jgi:predicted small secreted protein
MEPTAKLYVEGGHPLMGNTIMRKIIVLAVVAAALATSACNTISGMGRDVSAAGSAVSTGAETAKN